MKYNTRSLTNGELKALRQDHDINIGNLTSENAYVAKDLILEMILSKADIKTLDSQPYRKSQAVFDDIMSKTFGSEEDEKN